MGILTNLSKMLGASPAYILFQNSINSIGLAEYKKRSTKENIFEQILFNSAYIFFEYMRKNPSAFGQFKNEYGSELRNYAERQSIIQLIPCDYYEFVNERIYFYIEQIVDLIDKNKITLLPLKIYYYFFEKQLSNECYKPYSEDQLDKNRLEMILLLKPTLILTITKLNNDINTVFKEFKIPIISLSELFEKSQEFYNIGMLHFSMKNYEEANSFLKASIVLYPNNCQSYFELGKIALDGKNYGKALSNFDKAIELESSTGTFFEYRAKTHEELSNIPNAISDYINYVNREDEEFIFSTDYQKIGLLSIRVKDYNLAIHYFSKAISISRVDLKSLFFRGQAYYFIKDYKNSIIDLDKVILYTPKNPFAYYLRGRAKAQIRLYNESIKDFSEAILYEPQKSRIYFHRGISYFFLKNFQDAINDFTYYINCGHEDNQTFFLRGISYKNQGLIKAAIEDLKMASKLGHLKANNELIRLL